MLKFIFLNYKLHNWKYLVLSEKKCVKKFVNLTNYIKYQQDE